VLALACGDSADAGTYIASNPAGDQVLFHQVLAQTSRPLYIGVRHHGGSFGPLHGEVSPPGQFFPFATVDDGGGFVARWNSADPKFQSHPPTSAVAIGTPGGSLGPPTQPRESLGGIASNARGDTIASLVAADGTPSYMYRPAGGEFGPAQPLPDTNGGVIGFAVDEDGSVFAVLFGHGDELFQAIRPPSGDFGPPSPIPGTPSQFDNVQLGSARNGRALLVFGQSDSIRAMERPPGGAFGAPFDVATGVKRQPFADRVVLADSGAGLVSYVTQPTATYVTVRDPGGSFTTPLAIQQDARIAGNDQGDAAVAWAEDNYEVRAKYRAAGAAQFSAPRTLAPGRVFPRSPSGLPTPQPGLAIDDSGRATAAWELWDGATVSTIVRDFDASGSAAPLTVDVVPSFVQEAAPEACRPAGARILRSSKEATVFRGRFDRIYGCLLGRGHPIDLGQFGELEPQPARTMGLAGPFVAYGLDFIGHGDAFSRFYTIDLRDDDSGFNRATDLDGGHLAVLHAARGTPTGAVAWVSRRDGGKVKRVWVWNRTAKKLRLLDASRRVEGRSFRLKGSQLTWRRAGQLRHATLR
jgi:hypothetical protein